MTAAPHKEDADEPQLVLASDRTMLAIERTYAAWVRTGLAALASGVAAREFVDSAVPPMVAEIMASLLILFSGFCFIAGVWREFGHTAASGSEELRRVPSPILVAANAVMVLISAMALTGLWFAPR